MSHFSSSGAAFVGIQCFNISCHEDHVNLSESLSRTGKQNCDSLNTDRTFLELAVYLNCNLFNPFDCWIMRPHPKFFLRLCRKFLLRGRIWCTSTRSQANQNMYFKEHGTTQIDKTKKKCNLPYRKLLTKETLQLGHKTTNSRNFPSHVYEW